MIEFRPEYEGVVGKLNRVRVLLFWLFSFVTFAFYAFQAYVLYDGLSDFLVDLINLEIGTITSVILGLVFGFMPLVGNFIASFVGVEFLDVPYGVSFGLFMFVGLGLFVLTYKIYPAYYRHLRNYRESFHYREAYDDLYADGVGPSRAERKAAEKVRAQQIAEANESVERAFDYKEGRNDDPENAHLADFLNDIERKMKD